jgi:hypothetical protein
LYAAFLNVENGVSGVALQEDRLPRLIFPYGSPRPDRRKE